MKNQHRLALRPSLLTVVAAVALFGCVAGPTTTTSEPAVEAASLSTDPTTSSAEASVELAAQDTDLQGPETNFKACCTFFYCPANGDSFDWCTGNGGLTWGETRLACRAACGGAWCEASTFCEGELTGPAS